MARIRSIHPGTWTRKEFLRMSIEGIAGWGPLLTRCDDWGAFAWEPEELAAQIFPTRGIDFAALLAEWERLGLVRSYEAGGQRYGAVRGFCTEQSPKKPKPWHPLPRELLAFVGADAKNRPAHDKIAAEPVPPAAIALPPGGEPVSTGLTTGSPQAVDGAEPVPNRSGTGAIPVLDHAATGTEPVPHQSPMESEMEVGSGSRNLESEMDSDSGPAACAPAPSDHALFEEFWATGPRRIPEDPKVPAQTRYLAAVARGGIDPRVINAGRRRFAARCRALGDKFDPRYMAATERWLHEMRWIDEGSPDALLAEYRSSAGAAVPPAADAPPPAPVDPRWAAISKRLFKALGADVHASWIAPLAFVALEEGTLRLAVKTRFQQQWIVTHHGERMLECCRAHDGLIERIELAYDTAVATVGAERPPPERDVEKPGGDVKKSAADAKESPANVENSPPDARAQGPTLEQKYARSAVMTEGIAQLNGYEARGETRAIATLERWGETVGGNYVLIARLLDEAKQRKLEGAAALRWLEQQVGTHASGDVLPLKPVEAKAAPPAKRNGKRRRA